MSNQINLESLGVAIPTDLRQRIAESYTPGIKIYEWKKNSPRIPETIWPPYRSDNRIPMRRGGKELLPFQQDAVYAMARRGSCLLADQQGLGKTAQSIGLINLLGLKKIVIVAPNSNVLTWENELKEWLHNQHLVVASRLGTKWSYKDWEDGSRTLCRDQDHPVCDIMIIAYSAFSQSRIIQQLHKTILRNKPEILILDEVHFVRKEKTNRTINIFGSDTVDEETGIRLHRGIVDSISRKLFLSGTPVVNRDPMELFHWLKALDKNRFGNKSLFEARYMVDNRGRRPKNEQPENQKQTEPDLLKNEVFLGMQLRDGPMVRRLAKDVLDLPPLIPEVVLLRDTPDIIKAKENIESAIKQYYDKKGGYTMQEQDWAKILEDLVNSADESVMEGVDARMQEALDDIDNCDDEGKKELAVLIAEQTEAREQKLGERRQQIPLELISKCRSLLATAKAGAAPAAIDLLLSNLKKRGLYSGKCVIFYHHTAARDLLREGLKNLGFKDKEIVHVDGTVKSQIERQAAVEAFQKNPNVKFFLGGLYSASTGLTLTAANVVIFIEQDWVPAVMYQAMFRIYRLSQTASTVHSYILAVDGSIDSNMAEVLCSKKTFQRSILDTPPTERSLTYYQNNFAVDDYVVNKAKWNQTKREAIQIICDDLWKFLTKKDTFGEPKDPVPDTAVGNYDIAAIKLMTSDYHERMGFKLFTREFPEDRFITDTLLTSIWALRGWLVTVGKVGKGGGGTKKIKAVRPDILVAIEIPERITGTSSSKFISPTSPDYSTNGFTFLNSITSMPRFSLELERKAAKDKRKAEKAGLTEEEFDDGLD